MQQSTNLLQKITVVKLELSGFSDFCLKMYDFHVN